MELDLFAFLDGASPWWWIALALALGAIEMVTFTYFMLWLGLAAFTVGIGLALIPEAEGSTQILAFALLAMFYTAIGWGYVRRRQPSGRPRRTIRQGTGPHSAFVISCTSWPCSRGRTWTATAVACCCTWTCTTSEC